jgi:hypothetical protein
VKDAPERLRTLHGHLFTGRDGREQAGLQVFSFSGRLQGEQLLTQHAVVSEKQLLLLENDVQALTELSLEDLGKILQHLVQRRGLLARSRQVLLQPLDVGRFGSGATRHP